MLDAIDLLVLDVDGVLTDGRIVYDARGGELKFFSAPDGQGLRYWLRAGHEAAVLSGRASPAARRRAREVGIRFVRQGAKDKLPVFRNLLKRLKRTPERTFYVGDDLVDVPILSYVGFAVATAGASEEVKRVAHYVTRAGGGAGAVREVIEMILKYQGRWAGVTERYDRQLSPGLPDRRRPWRASR